MKHLMAKLAFVLRILCAAAFIAGGMTGAPQASERSLSVGEIAYFVLPDGSLPELCITLPDGNGTGKIVKISPDSAHSVNAFALAARIAEHGPIAIPADRSALAADRATVHPAQRSPVSGPRAPPIS